MSVTRAGSSKRAQRVSVGLDWATNDHHVNLLDTDGEPVQRFAIPDTKAGISRLLKTLSGYTVIGVGIERPDGPVVDALLQAGITVYVIPPAHVKALRQRYGSAGNKDDRFDAYVLADTVRTDHRRLTPFERDSDATIGLRQLCRARKDLIAYRIAVANQLRAHLSIALPAAVVLFSAIDSPISRKFLAQFTHQHAVNRLSAEQLVDWLKDNRYKGRVDPARLHQRMTSAPAGPVGPHGQILAEITRAYVHTLNTIMEQIKVLTKQITTALDSHPDRDIFTSLPKAGTVRAARLIGEIGDARGRFPTATALACLAGVVPSTRQSGTSRIVTYRWAVDKQLRDAICDFAGDSHNANPWAADLYHKARTRGHDHPHAVRILGRAWLDIIWQCWTNHTPYDPNQHKALQRLLNQDQPAAT
jgi:transposase